MISLHIGSSKSYVGQNQVKGDGHCYWTSNSVIVEEQQTTGCNVAGLCFFFNNARKNAVALKNP